LGVALTHNDLWSKVLHVQPWCAPEVKMVGIGSLFPSRQPTEAHCVNTLSSIGCELRFDASRSWHECCCQPLRLSPGASARASAGGNNEANNVIMTKGFVAIALGVALAGTGAQAVTNGLQPLNNGGTGYSLDDPPITIGAGWWETGDAPPAFFWGPGTGAPNLEGPFTFVSGGPVLLSVVDAFLKGDVFAVFDFGGPVGTTSFVLPAGGTTGDPNVAWGDPTYSQGSFLLGPGPHAITFAAVVNPFDGGRAYLRVDDATPRLPDSASTLGLALLGLASLAGYRRLVKP
jgi:hypothetical protein